MSIKPVTKCIPINPKQILSFEKLRTFQNLLGICCFVGYNFNMKKALKIKVSIIVSFLCLCFVAHSSVVYLKKFTFDENRALDKWNKMILNGEVDYVLTKYGNEGCIQAYSKEACSALYYRIGFNLRDYPFLGWKWKALQFPDMSRAMTKKEKDDYAARVYVIFPFLSFSSSKFLEYVWAEDIPVGTVIDSPFGNNVKIIVARSGKLAEEGWVSEIRNVYKDYIKVFRKKPARKVGAIAIMCDADGTKTLAESLFGDILIQNQK